MMKSKNRIGSAIVDMAIIVICITFITIAGKPANNTEISRFNYELESVGIENPSNLNSAYYRITSLEQVEQTFIPSWNSVDW